MDTTEKGLEEVIERSLLGSGFAAGTNDDYARAFCLDVATFYDFLRETQPTVWDKLDLAGGGAKETEFLKRLFDEIGRRGITECLRDGVKHKTETVLLYFKKPASGRNPDAARKHAANRWTVTRQLRYSDADPGKSLDMVLSVNGFPVVTLELKNRFTGQNVTHAIAQYRKDRSAKEPLFALGRVVAHFAVDDSQVYVAARLQNAGTQFLPFNQGAEDGGKGNPVSPGGLKTAYLWERILTPGSLAELLEKYALCFRDNPKLTNTPLKNAVFPRYHQLDLVRFLLADVRENGAGRTYLVQHSAGSGKSNSIAWLAHQLSETVGANGDDKPVFDSVIVITDRRNLDKQIADTVYNFAHIAGVVLHSENSKELREAIESGKRIIITTVHKFPYILNKIGDLHGKRFALVIDEAHSSQTSDMAAKMHLALAELKVPYTTETDIEDAINAIVENRKMLPNASYFAFTATPKAKTLQKFGRETPDGKFVAHHVYTMKQAIDEGFILDVLQHYTTIKSYYEIVKRIEGDPEYDKRRAQSKLRRFVESHPVAIRVKAEIMLSHFHDTVYVPRKIGGKAKAMVVTRSIASAIEYKNAFDALLKQRGSPYKAIVAFTGEPVIDGVKYSEFSMNGFPCAGNAIPDAFNKDEYRFLIVAEKYQTGFDQPLLHTMYVDKPLDGVQAVQTLSRLNRSHPDKTDTFVLDFVNDPETIQESFEPFYKTTILSRGMDVNRLNDLESELDGFGIYDRAGVAAFMAIFLSPTADRSALDPYLDTTAGEYANLDTAAQIRFKSAAKSFVRTYEFLAAVSDMGNAYRESLNTFLRLLLAKLPAPQDEDLAFGVLTDSELDKYRAHRQVEIAIALTGDTELLPVPTETGGGASEAEIAALSEILRQFNEKFGSELTDSDRISRFFDNEAIPAIIGDVRFQDAVARNDSQVQAIVRGDITGDVMRKNIVEFTELFKLYTDNAGFKESVIRFLTMKTSSPRVPSPP